MDLCPKLVGFGLAIALRCMPQEAPKTVSKTDFGAIQVDLWLKFWCFFGCLGRVHLVFLLVHLLFCWSRSYTESATGPLAPEGSGMMALVWCLEGLID